MVLITRITQQNINKLTVNIHQSICDINKTKGSESIVLYYVVCALDVIDGYKTGDGHVKFYLEELALAMNREAWWVEKNLKRGYKVAKTQNILSKRYKTVPLDSSFYYYLSISKDESGRKVVRVIYKSPYRILVTRGYEDPGAIVQLSFSELTCIKDLRASATYGSALLAQKYSNHLLSKEKVGLRKARAMGFKTTKAVLNPQSIIDASKLRQEVQDGDYTALKKAVKNKKIEKKTRYQLATVNYISDRTLYVSNYCYRVGASQYKIASLTERSTKTVQRRLGDYKDFIYHQYVEIIPDVDLNHYQKVLWTKALQLLKYGVSPEQVVKHVRSQRTEDGTEVFNGFVLHLHKGFLRCYRPYCNLYSKAVVLCKRGKVLNRMVKLQARLTSRMKLPVTQMVVNGETEAKLLVFVQNNVRQINAIDTLHGEVDYYLGDVEEPLYLEQLD